MKAVIIIFLAGVLTGCMPTDLDEKVVREHDFQESRTELLAYLDNREGANRDNPSYYFHRARLNDEVASFQQAVADIEKAIELDSTQASYYTEKSRIMANHQNFGRALWASREARKMGDYSPENRYSMAWSLGELGRADLALPEIRDAAKVDPLNPEIQELMGKLYIVQGDTTRGLMSLEECQRIQPGHASSFDYLISLYSKTGKEDRARSMIQSIPENERNTEMTMILVDLMIQKEELDSAELVLWSLPASNRRDQQLADVKTTQRSYDSALYYLDQILVRNPEVRSVRLSRARILARTGSNSQAMEIYQALLEENPEDSNVRQEMINLERKIAYLRKSQLEEQQRSLLQPLKLRKIEND